LIAFETIGNATITCIDGEPILTTDPWVVGDAYFGSWGFAYETPPEQLDRVLGARYIWLSHGHPDHANPASLDLLADKTILLPDHVGGRMAADLRQLGFRVQVMPDREWMPLSPHIRAMCVSDYHQDAILFIDINGRLVVDLNDAAERGWGRFARKLIASYPTSFMLKLFGYGDVDMINIVDDDGKKLIPPPPTASHEAACYWDDYLRAKISFWAKYLGTTHIVPFSCFHRYQREDSLWAGEYVTPVSAIEGMRVEGALMLPAFIRWDCERDTYTQIAPRPAPEAIRHAAEFGDSWSDPLDADEAARVGRYFTSIEYLGDHVDFVRFRVGGKEHLFDLDGNTGRGITFEVPRSSLLSAVQYEVFDDLLIGNFMKTTVHGDWDHALAPTVLYAHFTPWVVRYADNGRVRTHEELRDYFETYRQRAPFDYFMHRLEHDGVQKLRRLIKPGSGLFRTATRVYSMLKAPL
jgi:hypothetical protein